MATIEAEGSAFLCRTAAALAALVPGPTVIEGNATMCSRPMAPLFDCLGKLGATITDQSDATTYRVVIHGAPQIQRVVGVDSTKTSQFLTALLLIAPLFAENEIALQSLAGPMVGASYVDLTTCMMGARGCPVTCCGQEYRVSSGHYLPHFSIVPSDFTALSYLAGLILAVPAASIIVQSYFPSTLGSERQFLRVLDHLGVVATYNDAAHEMILQRGVPSQRPVSIDARDIPTVVPTLAAMTPFVDGAIELRHAAHIIIINVRDYRLSLIS